MSAPQVCPGCSGRGFHLVLLDEQGRLRALWIAEPALDTHGLRGVSERLCSVCEGRGQIAA